MGTKIFDVEHHCRTREPLLKRLFFGFIRAKRTFEKMKGCGEFSFSIARKLYKQGQVVNFNN